MIDFGNGKKLVQTVDELQLLPQSCVALFGDFETSSKDPKLDSLNPWHNCWPIGFAFTVDSDPQAYFVPWNLIKQDKTGWLWNLINSAKVWINHHVKYDAHVFCRHTGWKLPADLQLICTIVLARLIDADRSYKGGYGLDTLLLQWCGIDILPYYKRIEPYLYRKNGNQFNKDYGRIPLDLVAEYACVDVLGNRELYKYEMMNLPPECQDTSGATPALLQTEIKLTKKLFEIECNGLYIVPDEAQAAEFYCLARMVDIEEVIAEKLGYAMNPNSPDQIFDLICNRYGQPVRSWTNIDKDGKQTEKSNPSFDKKALKEYHTSLDTPKDLKDLIKLIMAYKVESQHLGLFYRPWQVLQVEGLLHGSYQQNVRSGRMAMRQPNGQQLDKRAKKLIKPKPGYVMLAHDYSQIEYRIIIHYLRNPKAVREYNENPDIDYHAWVSQLCQIDRQPAKTMNFLMAFGGGKKKAINTLAADFNTKNEKLLAQGKQVRMLSVAELNAFGQMVFSKYHANIPELTKVSGVAQDRARYNGFVRNGAGRRLHLPGLWYNHWIGKDGKPIDRCHIAFNRAVQSFASDIAKERVVALMEQDWFIEAGCEVIALVHDAFYIQCPDRPDAELLELNNRIRAFLEATPFKLAVPLRVDSGYSRKNMADCDAARYCDIDTRLAGGKHSRDNSELEYAKQDSPSIDARESRSLQSV